MNRHTRRGFLEKSAKAFGTAWAATHIIPGGMRRADASANERLAIALIGAGGMGRHDLVNMITQPDVQFVAVCDVDTQRRQGGKKIVDDYYGNANCAEYRDFREVLARDDIDAVVIATPDHWHGLIAVAAAERGKDIYCEKPISLTIGEGRQIVEAMNRYGVVYQSGTQRRSIPCFKFPIEMARSGRLGRIHTIHTHLGVGPTCEPQPIEPVPEGFDYDMWLGPAPYMDYTPRRCHGSFRWLWDYSGGKLTDIGAHFNDLAQFGNDSEHTGPVSYEGWGELPGEGLFETPIRYEIRATYADGVKLIMHANDPYVCRFEGDEGWASITDNGTVDAEPKSLLKLRSFETQDYQVMAGHHRNWLDCVRTRQTPIAPPEVAHRSTTICHAGNICIRLARGLRWDPEAEQFIDDEEANHMLARAKRAPWRL